MSANLIPATLIPGDGIGPEITAATIEVLDALGAPFRWETQVAGLAGVTACGDPLPQACIDSIRKNRPVDLDRGVATPDFDPDVLRCWCRGSKRQLHKIVGCPGRRTTNK